MGNDGKIITETLKDYTKNTVTKQYQTLDMFKDLNSAEKEAIIKELESKGYFDVLKEQVGKDFDPSI